MSRGHRPRKGRPLRPTQPATAHPAGVLPRPRHLLIIRTRSCGSGPRLHARPNVGKFTICQTLQLPCNHPATYSRSGLSFLYLRCAATSPDVYRLNVAQHLQFLLRWYSHDPPRVPDQPGLSPLFINEVSFALQCQVVGIVPWFNQYVPPSGRGNARYGTRLFDCLHRRACPNIGQFAVLQPPQRHRNHTAPSLSPTYHLPLPLPLASGHQTPAHAHSKHPAPALPSPCQTPAATPPRPSLSRSTPCPAAAATYSNLSRITVDASIAWSPSNSSTRVAMSSRLSQSRRLSCVCELL